MMPIRQRAAFAARQACAAFVRPAMASTPSVRFGSTDSHGSHDHHDHGHAAPVDEPMGTAFFVFLGAIPFTYALYALSRPGKDGEPTAIEAYLNKFSYLTTQWETRNTLHTAAIDQATQDKNLFYNVPRNTHVELRNPEIFMAGSPYNVPAGHNINLDKVVEHYRQQHLKEVARQQAAAAAKAQ